MDNSKKNRGSAALDARRRGGSSPAYGQRQTTGSNGTAKPNQGRKRVASKSPWWATAGRYMLYALALLSTAAVTLVLILAMSLKMMCSDSFPDLQSRLVTTFLETGQFKFVPSLFLSSEKIQAIVNKNSMSEFNEEVDTGLINIGGAGSINLSAEEKEWGDIEIFEIKGSTYYGTLIYLKDPSRLSVATIYPWRDYGVTLDELVESAGAIGGINGGLYNSYNNSGGTPYGVVVSNGEIQLNEPQSWPGLVLIGLTDEHILQIIDISSMTPNDIVALVAERHIRDAVTFQEESSDANNHFVQLVINGEAREMSGAGSGLNPRTAIGQRADGSMLLLVTDGRGKNGHTGASAFDLINIMMKYGAVNAANLDGGSSSCMYYDGEFLMDSVTFYYSNTSWRLPLGFVFK